MQNFIPISQTAKQEKAPQVHKDLINEIDVADDQLVNDEVDMEAAAIMTQKQRPMSSGTFSNMIPS